MNAALNRTGRISVKLEGETRELVEGYAADEGRSMANWTEQLIDREVQARSTGKKVVALSEAHLSAVQGLEHVAQVDPLTSAALVRLIVASRESAEVRREVLRLVKASAGLRR